MRIQDEAGARGAVEGDGEIAARLGRRRRPAKPGSGGDRGSGEQCVEMASAWHGLKLFGLLKGFGLFYINHTDKIWLYFKKLNV
jgi:hypothetical protein